MLEIYLLDEWVNNFECTYTQTRYAEYIERLLSNQKTRMLIQTCLYVARWGVLDVTSPLQGSILHEYVAQVSWATTLWE